MGETHALGTRLLSRSFEWIKGQNMNHSIAGCKVYFRRFQMYANYHKDMILTENFLCLQEKNAVCLYLVLTSDTFMAAYLAWPVVLVSALGRKCVYGKKLVRILYCLKAE